METISLPNSGGAAFQPARCILEGSPLTEIPPGEIIASAAVEAVGALVFGDGSVVRLELRQDGAPSLYARRFAPPDGFDPLNGSPAAAAVVDGSILVASPGQLWAIGPSMEVGPILPTPFSSVTALQPYGDDLVHVGTAGGVRCLTRKGASWQVDPMFAARGLTGIRDLAHHDDRLFIQTRNTGIASLPLQAARCSLATGEPEAMELLRLPGDGARGLTAIAGDGASLFIALEDGSVWRQHGTDHDATLLSSPAPGREAGIELHPTSGGLWRTWADGIEWIGASSSRSFGQADGLDARGATAPVIFDLGKGGVLVLAGGSVGLFQAPPAWADPWAPVILFLAVGTVVGMILWWRATRGGGRRLQGYRQSSQRARRKPRVGLRSRSAGGSGQSALG